MTLSKRHLGLLVLGVLLVSLALRFAPLTIGAFVTVNEDTQRFEERGWHGTGFVSYEAELLDGTEYITSWMPESGDSEKILAGGQIMSNLFNPNFLWGCRYSWELNVGLGWVPMDEPIQDVACPSTFYGTEWSVLEGVNRVLHSPVVGGIAVELQVNVGPPFFGAWVTVARDEARLLPGVGDIFLTRNIWAVGETAIILFDVGYASSQREGGTWTIQLFAPRDRGRIGPVEEWPIGPGPGRGQVTWTIAPSDFILGESNLFTVKLLNTVTAVRDDDFVTVDDVGLAPVILSVSVQPPGTREVGDGMTVTIAAEPNARTGLPIQAYYFHIRSSPSNVIVDRWQATNVFTFTIQNDGDVQVNACVRDAERSNCFRRINVIVEEPDNPFGTNPADPFTPPWWLWLSVGILLAFAFGVQLLPQIPQDARRLLGVFLLAGSAVLVLSYFVIPVLEAWFRDIIPGVG